MSPNDTTPASAEDALLDKFRRTRSALSYDAEWQYPAITEEYAYRQAVKLLPETPGVIYFGFPWATFFDLMNEKLKDRALRFVDVLNVARHLLAGYEQVITVCQHILLHKYRKIISDLGITDVYWSHAIKGQERFEDYPNVSLHAFPLYPVQVVGYVPRERAQKKYLFSFVGARTNLAYLTKTRRHLFALLADDPRGRVIGRKMWHFSRIVYGHQIHGKFTADQAKDDGSAAAEFRQALLDSTFTLCPSGSGPNSIRLWESIGVGSIPVVLADTYRPPGDDALWNEAVVTCPERLQDIMELPDRLEALAKDEGLLAAKRAAMRKLWKRYGPDCFIYDIQQQFLGLTVTEAKKTAAPPGRAADGGSSNN